MLNLFGVPGFFQFNPTELGTYIAKFSTRNLLMGLQPNLEQGGPHILDVDHETVTLYPIATVLTEDGRGVNFEAGDRFIGLVRTMIDSSDEALRALVATTQGFWRYQRITDTHLLLKPIHTANLAELAADDDSNIRLAIGYADLTTTSRVMQVSQLGLKDSSVSLQVSYHIRLEQGSFAAIAQTFGLTFSDVPTLAQELGALILAEQYPDSSFQDDNLPFSIDFSTNPSQSRAAVNIVLNNTKPGAFPLAATLQQQLWQPVKALIENHTAFYYIYDDGMSAVPPPLLSQPQQGDLRVIPNPQQQALVGEWFGSVSVANFFGGIIADPQRGGLLIPTILQNPNPSQPPKIGVFPLIAQEPGGSFTVNPNLRQGSFILARDLARFVVDNPEQAAQVTEGTWTTSRTSADSKDPQNRLRQAIMHNRETRRETGIVVERHGTHYSSSFYAAHTRVVQLASMIERADEVGRITTVLANQGYILTVDDYTILARLLNLPITSTPTTVASEAVTHILKTQYADQDLGHLQYQDGNSWKPLTPDANGQYQIPPYAFGRNGLVLEFSARQDGVTPTTSVFRFVIMPNKAVAIQLHQTGSHVSKPFPLDMGLYLQFWDFTERDMGLPTIRNATQISALVESLQGLVNKPVTLDVFLRNGPLCDLAQDIVEREEITADEYTLLEQAGAFTPSKQKRGSGSGSGSSGAPGLTYRDPEAGPPIFRLPHSDTYDAAAIPAMEGINPKTLAEQISQALCYEVQPEQLADPQITERAVDLLTSEDLAGLASLLGLKNQSVAPRNTESTHANDGLDRITPLVLTSAVNTVTAF